MLVRRLPHAGVLALTALAPAALTAQVAAATGATGVVRGRVIQGDGRPAAGAAVTLRATDIADGTAERTATTDAQGRFLVGGLAAGEYVVRARALGYQPAERGRLRVGAPAGSPLGAPDTLDVALVLGRVPAPLAAVTVTATRSAAALADVPQAVTVIERAQLAEQVRVTPKLGAALAQLVPGLAAGTETVSNFGQNLRGRTVLVLIDGVPQSTNRNVTRDFATIDPAMVERVEVVRGASAVFGDGATGGVINVITRRGEDGPLRFTTDLQFEAAGSAPGTGFGPRVAQTVSGARGAWDFLAGGVLSRTGASFDAQGDRISSDPTGQGGTAETNGYDVLGKLGWTQNAQRAQLTLNRFYSEQATDYAADATVVQAPPGTKARARRGLELDRGQGTENTVLNLEYAHAAVLGSRVRAQAYLRDYQTRFGPGDNRAFASLGNLIFQSYVDSEKRGGRLEVETPLARVLPRRFDASLLWGADYSDETTSQPVTTFDPAAYDASSGLAFRPNGQRLFVPPIDARNLGLFAQATVTPFARLVLRGGVRHERAAFRTDAFTALNGVSFAGGTLRFAPTLANAGAVLTVAAPVSVYANVSQGFSLADLGRTLRQPPAGFTLRSREAEAQRVDQVEAGVRGAWARVQATASAFRSTSALGTAFGPTLEVVRAPERVYGLEGTLDAQPTARLTLGGIASWTEGDYRSATPGGAVGDSTWLPLNSFRIQPLKLTAYLEHRTLARWTTRVQALHSGARDRAYDAFLDRPGVNPATPGFGERRVRAYTTVDLLSRVTLARGTLSVGARNLLNAQYFPVVSQLMPIGAVSYSAAPGRVLTLGYTVTY